MMRHSANYFNKRETILQKKQLVAGCYGINMTKHVLAFLYMREHKETRIFMPRWKIASMNDCLTITLTAEHITMAPAYINAVFRLTLFSGEKYLINPPKNRGWVTLHIATYKMHHTHAKEKRLFGTLLPLSTP